MRPEKIAFLFPFKWIHDGTAPPPLLAYDFEELPADIYMNAGVFFVGLQNRKPYYLEVQVFRSQGDKEIQVSERKNLSIMPGDRFAHEEEIAASIDISQLKCRFEEPGSYFISASLFDEEEWIHSNKAYFRVSKFK